MSIFDDITEEDLLNDDIVEDENSKNKTKSNNNKQNRTVNYNETKGIPKNRVMIILGICIVLFTIIGGVIGVMIGGADSNNNQTTQQQVVKEAKVTSVESLSESLRSTKDDQIKVLQTQLSNLNKGKDSKGVVSDENLAKHIDEISKNNEVIYKNIDKFLDKYLAVKRYANDSDKDVSKKAMSEHVEDKSDTLIYKALNGLTPAKDLEQDGTKAGTSFVSMLSYNKDGVGDYLVLVPYTTLDKKETYQVTILVTANKDGKILDFNYLGYFKEKNSENIYKLLEKHIKISDNKTTEDAEKSTENKE